MYSLEHLIDVLPYELRTYIYIRTAFVQAPDRRLRRRLNMEPTLDKCTMFERKSSCPANTRHLYNIYTTSAQRLRRWPNIASSHTKVLSLLGVNTSLGSGRFHIPSVIQSVCLRANDQVGASDKGFELLTHRCRSSIYELAVI